MTNHRVIDEKLLQTIYHSDIPKIAKLIYWRVNYE